MRWSSGTAAHTRSRLVARGALSHSLSRALAHGLPLTARTEARSCCRRAREWGQQRASPCRAKQQQIAGLQFQVDLDAGRAVGGAGRSLHWAGRGASGLALEWRELEAAVGVHELFELLAGKKAAIRTWCICRIKWLTLLSGLELLRRARPSGTHDAVFEAPRRKARAGVYHGVRASTVALEPAARTIFSIFAKNNFLSTG